MASKHGKLVRGADHVPSSHLPMGRFGRMFRELPPALHAEATLRALAETMLVDGPSEDNSLVASDGQENCDIPAGYTYLGQFIDHDLTLDTASSLERANDPDALVDFRTPRFDLDSVYGRGPADQPYLYDEDGMTLLEGLAGDLPRSAKGRAIIGDPRNDENRIVSQLQTIFLRFHNQALKSWRSPACQATRCLPLRNAPPAGIINGWSFTTFSSVLLARRWWMTF